MEKSSPSQHSSDMHHSPSRAENFDPKTSLTSAQEHEPVDKISHPSDVITARALTQGQEPPFTPVSGNNYVPTAPEFVQTRAFTALHLREIDKLDDEINEHLAIIDSLATHRSQYQETVDRHQALLSPIRRIFPEILQEIFGWCIPEHPSMSHTTAPLLLGRICSDWRSLAYGTVELWSALHIVIPPAGSNSLPPSQIATTVHAWLERAGGSPLRISVLAHHPVQDIQPLIGELLLFKENWHTVILDIPKISAINLFSGFSGKLPMLRGLKFRLVPPSLLHWQIHAMAWDDSADTGMRGLLQFVVTHPTMRYLYIQVESTIGWFPQLPVPPNTVQSSLTSLSLQFHNSFITLLSPSEHFLILLGAFPNLVRLSLSCSHTISPIRVPVLPPLPARPKRVHLDKLEALGIRIWNKYVASSQRTTVITDILNQLVTPSLTQVDLGLQKDETGSFREMWFSLMDLVARSEASLGKLCIRRHNQVLHNTLRECLVQCPEVRELVVERTDSGFTLVPQVGPEKTGNEILGILSDNAICPNLNTLSLFQFTPSHLDQEVLLDFLQRRTSQTVSPFEKFSLLPPLQFSTWHTSWNNDFKQAKDWDYKEYDEEFWGQVEELNASSGLQVYLGDVGDWARSSPPPWFGFTEE